MRFAWPLAAIVSVLLGVHLFVASMWLTGDETKYAAQGLGIYTNGTLHPNALTWNAFVAKSALRPDVYAFATVAGKEAQTLGPSAVFGLVLRLLGLEAARWLNFAIGAAGLVALYALLRKRYAEGVRAAITVSLSLTTVAFALPFVAYVRLLYPEILLFTTVACALYALATDRRTVAISAAGLLPFEHIRALPLSLTLACLIAWDARSQPRGERMTIGIFALYGALLLAWAFVQMRVYGSLAGHAFATYAPSVSGFFPRLALQLFDVRHGLIAYAPIYLIGFAGLLTGMRARDPLCMRACVLLLSYVATFVWSTAGESWTARFWVAALPMLAIGIAYWLARAHSWQAVLALGACFAVTLTNTIVYCLHPMWFVQDRTVSIAYAAIASFAHFTIGAGFLPVDDGSADGMRLAILIIATACATAGLMALIPSRRVLER